MSLDYLLTYSYSLRMIYMFTLMYEKLNATIIVNRRSMF